jgi:uncharacterized protein (TIGR04222 family)
MNQPWGLSGPQFLWIYGAGMAAFFAAPWAIALFARAVSTSFPRVPGLVLDAYEVGYLAGGAQRAAEVVIGELATSGVLRVDSAGRISRADRARLAEWSATCPHGISSQDIPDGLRAKRVRRRLAKDPGIMAIGARLRADGLLIARSWVIAGRVTAGALWLALMVAGALRLAEGAHNHRPIVDLQDLYMFTVVLGLYSLLLQIGQIGLRATSTRTGSSYLKSLTKEEVQRQVQVHLMAERAADLAAQRAERNSGRAQGRAARSRGAVPAAGATVIAQQAALFSIALVGVAAVEDPALRAALLAGLPSPGGGGCGGGGGGGGCGGGGCGG